MICDECGDDKSEFWIAVDEDTGDVIYICVECVELRFEEVPEN